MNNARWLNYLLVYTSSKAQWHIGFPKYRCTERVGINGPTLLPRSGLRSEMVDGEMMVGYFKLSFRYSLH